MFVSDPQLMLCIHIEENQFTVNYGSRREWETLVKLRNKNGILLQVEQDYWRVDPWDKIKAFEKAKWEEAREHEIFKSSSSLRTLPPPSSSLQSFFLQIYLAKVSHKEDVVVLLQDSW